MMEVYVLPQSIYDHKHKLSEAQPSGIKFSLKTYGYHISSSEEFELTRERVNSMSMWDLKTLSSRAETS